jgi:hypothetical protein
VGLLASVITTWILESRRQGAEERREARRRDLQFRKASRLVMNELKDAQFHLDVAFGTEELWLRPEYALPSELWRQYRDDLALRLEFDDWTVVEDSYSQAARVNRTIESHERQGTTGPPSKVVWDQIEDALSAVIAALDVLQRFGG